VKIAGPKRGTWYDHEYQIGGGTREMLLVQGSAADEAGIAEWFKTELGIDLNPDKQHIVATYDYVDEQGALLFQVLRWGPKKTFSQQQPGNGKGGTKRGPDGKPTMQGARYVPYHLDELTAAKARANGKPWRVFVPEGEKDVDKLRRWGVTASCNPGGAGKWRKEYGPYFTGAEVVLLADNDQARREHVAAVARMLAPFAPVIKIVELGGLPEKGDISGWIDAGGTQSDLEDLADCTAPYDPNQSANNPKLNPQPGFDGEPWPEPARLLGDEWATPLFPNTFLPGPLGEFAASQAFDLQVPLDYIGIPLLIAAATAIGKEFRIAPKAHAGWTERACLWGGIVGYVGDGKTPSFNAALGPIWALQAKFRDEFQEVLKAWQTKVRLAKIINKQWERDVANAVKKGLPTPELPAAAASPQKPVPRQLVTNDVTQEKLAELMHHNPRGIMLYRDELSGWFRSFNQYRPGSDEQFYLQCHAGGQWHQQRKSGGDYTIPDLYLSICGGFQPDVVAEVLARRPGKADIGMAARFSLLVWPDHMPRQWVDNSPDRELRAQVASLFSRLLSKDPEGFVGPRPEGASHFPPLHFTPEAQEVFRDWYTAHHQAQGEIDPDSPLRGHFAKYDGLFAQLALIHHLLRHALGDPEVLSVPARVDHCTATAVRSFIEDYLRPHARKIYRHLGRDPGYEGAKRIARWILADPAITSFTAREISRKQWAGLTGRDENSGKDYLRAALYHLDNVAGWVRTDETPPGPRGGRPTTVCVINPRIAR
jgi:hypothetical protein